MRKVAPSRKQGRLVFDNEKHDSFQFVSV